MPTKQSPISALLFRNLPQVDQYTISLINTQGLWYQCRFGPYDPPHTCLRDLIRDSHGACEEGACSHRGSALIEEEKLLIVRWTPSVTPSGRYYLIENLQRVSSHHVDHMVHEEDTLESILHLSGLTASPSCMEQLSLLS